MPTSHNTLYLLPEISFIGGTDKVLTFTTYRANGSTLLDISLGSIEWMLSLYSALNNTLITKTGALTSANTFTVSINHDDTVLLSGKYTQQIIITDVSGKTFRVAEGIIIILPSIQ